MSGTKEKPSASIQKHSRSNLKRRTATKNISDPGKVLTINDVNGKQNEKQLNMEEIFVSPDCFDFLDDLLLFSIFRQTTVLREKGYGYGRAELVKVIVMVSPGLLYIGTFPLLID
jgi:hypothetical protein